MNPHVPRKNVRCRWMIVLVCLASLLLGCQHKPAGDGAAALPDATSSNAAGTANTLQLADDLERQLSIPQPVQRVISLAPSCTEILFAIGAGDRVVGVTSFSNYPAEALKLPQVGGLSRETISVEQIVGLRPDVIFAAGSLQRDLIEDLEGLGLTVVALEPDSVAGILDDIELAGRIMQAENAAQQLVDQLRKELQATASVIAKLEQNERPRVFYQVWHRPLRTASSNCYLGELIELAGGRNIFSDLTEAFPLVSEEAVVERNPQVILAPRHEGADVEHIRAHAGWDQVDAVQRGRIVLLDEDLVSRPGPRVTAALRHLAAAIHPEHFAPESPAGSSP